MLKVDLGRLLKRSFYILLLLIPVFGLYDLLNFLGISGFSGFEIVYLKLPKDVITLGVLFIGVILFVRKSHSLEKLFYFLLLFQLTIVSIFYSFENVGFITILAGLRWSLPFFIFALLKSEISKEFVQRITLLLSVILSFNLLFQILEMFFMPPIFGPGFFGFSGRLPGFFAQASIAGIYSVLVVYLNLCFNPSQFGRRIFISLAILSTFLTQSTLAIVLCLFQLTFKYLYSNRYKWVLFIVLFPIFVLCVLNIDTLVGRRDGDSSKSFQVRVSVLKDHFQETGLLSDDFGLATNTAKNFQREFEVSNESFIVDSLYTSVMANYGFIGLIFLILLLILLLAKSLASRDENFLLLTMTLILASVSLIVTEIFPANYIFVILFSYFLSPKVS